MLTSEILVCEALLVGEQEGEEPIQACRGPPGDDVEEDGSVEDLEDGGRVGSRSLGGRRLLPAGETPALATGAAPRLPPPVPRARGCSATGDRPLGTPVRPGRPPQHSSPALPGLCQLPPGAAALGAPGCAPREGRAEGLVTLRHRGGSQTGRGSRQQRGDGAGRAPGTGNWGHRELRQDKRWLPQPGISILRALGAS